MIKKIIKNFKKKTLISVSINYFYINIWQKIIKPKHHIESPLKLFCRVTESPEEAVEFLLKRVGELTNQDQYALFISSDDSRSDYIKVQLTRNQTIIIPLLIDDITKFRINGGPEPACIFTSILDGSMIYRIGQSLLQNQDLFNVPFEYVCIPKTEYGALEKYDNYNKFSFVSPLLLSEVKFNKIYEDSIEKFELNNAYFHYTAKCDVRDYMDLNQILSHVYQNKVPGEIAEFGSYKGHSGFLMAEVLKALNLEKKIYLFDTFQEFPSENIGIDSFWSNTHKVDFEQVKSKFHDFKNVILVKGDFTKTLPETSIDKLCFIYVDCDSFRATKFLNDNLFEQKLSPGGVMVFEDYGHPALLGNRLAIHNYFDTRKDCFRFFSQFSGYYIVTKLY
jgi:predicted O-methyltransferase YrrM